MKNIKSEILNFKFLILFLCPSFLFAQDTFQQTKQEKPNPVDVVHNWEQARRTFDSAIIARDMEKKVELYNRVLDFYEKQEPKPYDDILQIYSSLAFDYTSIEAYEDIDKIIQKIKIELPEKYHNEILTLNVHVWIQQQDYLKVIEGAKKYVANVGDNRFSYTFIGLGYLLSENYNKAIEAFNHILNKESSFKFIRLYRGICATRLGEYDAAIADFDFYLKATRAFGPKSS
ncbi:MAG: hypothetical protein JXB24_00005, partial [Bacteroidales bacterium]|nr:hypothetical protein [Bacteroidales bacterium]